MDEKLREYEGLVFRTAQIYERLLGIEREDLQQVLRVKVWTAVRAYDPTRNVVSERSYVFTCVRNQIKDLVKAKVRRDRYGREVFLDDVAPPSDPDSPNARDRFDHEHLNHEDELPETVLLPSTLSHDERLIIGLLYVGYRPREIAAEMSVPAVTIHRNLRRIKQKMADWRPTTSSAEVLELSSELVEAFRRSLRAA